MVHTRQSPVPFFFVSLGFLVVGLLLAVFAGLGWLFLLLAVRRVLTALPSTRRWLRARFRDLPEENPGTDRQLMLVTGVLRGVAALAWLALALIIFLQGNPSLLDMTAP